MSFSSVGWNQFIGLPGNQHLTFVAGTEWRGGTGGIIRFWAAFNRPIDRAHGESVTLFSVLKPRQDFRPGVSKHGLETLQPVTVWEIAGGIGGQYMCSNQAARWTFGDPVDVGTRWILGMRVWLNPGFELRFGGGPYVVPPRAGLPTGAPACPPTP